MAITTGQLSLQARTELKQELNEAYLEEEFFWKQKSRIQWLRAEDRNTKYFHAVARGKRIRNTVTTIQDENRVIRKGHKEVSDVAVEYFEDLYSSSPVDQALYDDVFTGFHSRVSSDMNADLTQVVTMEEIQQAVFDIGPHRAPGHDGFSSVFYHQFWEDLKPEIMQEVAELFERGELDRQLNHTNLYLIPKVYPPTGMSSVQTHSPMQCFLQNYLQNTGFVTTEDCIGMHGNKSVNRKGKEVQGLKTWNASIKHF